MVPITDKHAREQNERGWGVWESSQRRMQHGLGFPKGTQVIQGRRLAQQRPRLVGEHLSCVFIPPLAASQFRLAHASPYLASREEEFVCGRASRGIGTGASS